MKGYLQRLMTTVTRNDQRVFPVVGSVFSDPLREGNEGVVAPGVPMVDHRAQPVAAVPAESAQPVMHEERVQAPVPQASKLLMPAHMEAPALSGLTQGTTELAASATVAKTLREEDAVTESKPTPRETSLPLEVHVVHATQQRMDDTAAIGPERRVPAAETRASAVPLVPAPNSQDTIARPAPIKAPPLRRAEAKAANAEKGGDVQIHIGRIEVIATPPAPPRSAHAAPNRFTSLSDYLKRRNGRVG